MTKLYCARWVLPVASAPISDGAVAVEGARIAGVGARAELEERFQSASVEDFGEAAILPGLVNCHTHLELTAMRGFLEPEEGDFFAWLIKVTIARGARMTTETSTPLRRGARSRPRALASRASRTRATQARAR